MNKIFNKLFLGLAVCGLAMTACSDGVEWEPSPVPTEGVQAYIYADNTDLLIIRMMNRFLWSKSAVRKQMRLHLFA